MSEKYLTIKEVQGLYNVGDQTVRKWVRSGMPCIRLSAQILRFKESEVQTWLAENKMIDKHPLSKD